MGWWSIRKDTKEVYNPHNHVSALDESELLTIGDGPMDVITTALKKVARMYKRDLKHKPTPDELAALLESCIRIHEEDLFDDMDERELDSISVLLRQRPKRPRPKQGDFFAIPLPAGGYGYGRVMKVTLRVLLWMKLLNVHSDHILPLQDVQNAKIILDLETGTKKIDSTEWLLIGYLPLTIKEQKLLESEPHWITNYTAKDIEDIAEWKLSRRRGLPPNMDPPYVGYRY